MKNFPCYAHKCIETIEKNGFEAYFVGGCVRDSLLGKEAKDIDVTTSAKPDDIIKIFENTVPTGIKHGTVTVIIDGFAIEVTTYRTENTYKDSRHPESVNFVSTIDEDLSRRDFTINAMAYSPSRGLVDLHNGTLDLDQSLIRTVGNPFSRFDEDALRILRAFRFSSTLDFEIEENTLSAAKKLAHNLEHISGERIFSELKKLAGGFRPEILNDLVCTGALKPFGISSESADPSVLNNVSKLTHNDELKLVCLITLFGHESETIKKKLKPDNHFTKALLFLDNEHYDIKAEKESVKLFMHRFNANYTDLYIDFLSLTDADKASRIKAVKQEIVDSKEPYRICDLAINGDMIKSKCDCGRAIGELLERATLFVIKYPKKNNPKDIFDFLDI